MQMKQMMVAMSTITSLPISPYRKHAVEGVCFDWLTVQGHWVSHRAMLLIKLAINISITICTYFRDDLGMIIFLLLRGFFFFPFENISEVDSNNTDIILWNRKILVCQI